MTCICPETHVNTLTDIHTHIRFSIKMRKKEWNNIFNFGRPNTSNLPSSLYVRFCRFRYASWAAEQGRFTRSASLRQGLFWKAFSPTSGYIHALRKTWFFSLTIRLFSILLSLLSSITMAITIIVLKGPLEYMPVVHVGCLPTGYPHPPGIFRLSVLFFKNY